MTRDDFQARTGVSRETLDGFDRWRQILVETSAHTNLVARSSLDHFWERHALDSFQLMPLVSRETRLVADLGAGAGFPAGPLPCGPRGEPEGATGGGASNVAMM